MTQKITITAKLPVYNSKTDERADIRKTFDAEIRNGEIECPEMISWAKGHKDRMANIIWIEYTTDRKHELFLCII